MFENRFKPQSRNQDIVIQELKNEILIYDLIADKAFCLNESSLLVWRACDGSRTISEISAEISRHTRSPVSADLIWLALEQLRDINLIESEGEIPIPSEGSSRREIIRKLGLTSIIALPVILSLIAPTAGHAQSVADTCSATTGRPLGCACTANTQCAGTSTTRCCSNVPLTSHTCVPARTLRTTGQSCGNNCDCVSNSCVGPTGNETCA